MLGRYSTAADTSINSRPCTHGTGMSAWSILSWLSIRPFFSGVKWEAAVRRLPEQRGNAPVRRNEVCPAGPTRSGLSWLSQPKPRPPCAERRTYALMERFPDDTGDA